MSISFSMPAAARSKYPSLQTLSHMSVMAAFSTSPIRCRVRLGLRYLMSSGMWLRCTIVAAGCQSLARLQNRLTIVTRALALTG